MSSTGPDMMSPVTPETAEKRGFRRRPRRDQEQATTFTVPCAACDEPATISFEPRDGEPVYCNECFQPQPKSLDHVMRRNGYRPGGFMGQPGAPRWQNGRRRGSGQANRRFQP